MAIKLRFFDSNDFWYSSWLIPLALFLMLPTMWFEPPGTSGVTAGSKKMFATAIVYEEQVRGSHKALGPPVFPVCFSCFSELWRGSLILDFGRESMALMPKSLVVYSIDSKYRFFYDEPEKFEVFLSRNLSVWEFLGAGCGITQFSLSPEFSGFRYIKLQSRLPSNKNYGPKIDAVQLNY